MISRRHFLQLSARSAATLAGSASLLHLSRMNAFAQAGSGYRALVCVFLYGGNDGNNTIVPMDTAAYQGYAKARATVALSQGSLLPISTPSGGAYGLHPKLVGMRQLFQQQRVAVVANVGMLVRPIARDAYQSGTGAIPRNLFSHIDQQLAWQTAVAAGNATTGWGGRAADLVGPAGPTSYPASVSVSGNAVFGTGAGTFPATIIPGVAPGLSLPAGEGWAANALQSFSNLLTFDSGTVLVRTASDTTREGLRQGKLLTAALATRGALATPFPNSPLGQQLAEVAKVINVREELGATRQIFFCSLSGFDTHVAQLSQHATALAQLDEALSAFATATQEMAIDRQVTTFTESEFGRTLQPTVGTGTDHAWGNHHLVMGGAVRGGDLYGQFPTMALGGPDDVSKRGVWLPTVSLDQDGATLASWFGVGAGNLPAIFPNIGNFAATNLGFLEA